MDETVVGILCEDDLAAGRNFVDQGNHCGRARVEDNSMTGALDIRHRSLEYLESRHVRSAVGIEPLIRIARHVEGAREVDGGGEALAEPGSESAANGKRIDREVPGHEVPFAQTVNRSVAAEYTGRARRQGATGRHGYDAHGATYHALHKSTKRY